VPNNETGRTGTVSAENFIGWNLHPDESKAAGVEKTKALNSSGKEVEVYEGYMFYPISVSDMGHTTSVSQYKGTMPKIAEIMNTSFSNFNNYAQAAGSQQGKLEGSIIKR